MSTEWNLPLHRLLRSWPQLYSQPKGLGAGGSSTGCSQAGRRSPESEQLQQVVTGAHQAPFAVHLLQAPQQELA